MGILVFLGIMAGVARGGEPISVTGTGAPELADFDRIVPEFMRKWAIPGGALGVAKDGRLVLARGYGLADVEAAEPVRPDALFRIASLAKPFTAAALLKLVERGKLALDDPVEKWLSAFPPTEGQTRDPRFAQITIRQLLMHTGGFDHAKSFDPMTGGRPLVEALGSTANQKAIIEFMLVRPLDFDPGQRYAYSNFGYCLLGRVIEQATGQTYESAMRELVLRPAGIRRMRLARTRRADRAPGEVCYYAPPGEKRLRSIFAEDEQPVSAPYGACYLEPMDSHGGWLASTVDLLRFVTALEGSRGRTLLKPETFRLIDARPAKRSEHLHYGLGWAITSGNQEGYWSHAGSLPGTATMLLRTSRGAAAAIVFNCRPRKADVFFPEMEAALLETLRNVKTWPGHDLFPKYP